MSDEIISRLTELENALVEALEQEDFETAEQLTAQRQNLLKEFVDKVHSTDDEGQKAELEAFGSALKEHYAQMSESLTEKRDAVRKELMQLHHNQAGAQAYRQVRRTR
ncbi:MAG: flagellar protein FliT [Proteobacteria bacterium]|uniref:Flagellar protein FliT n=1 Tax=Candidatus Avisuccinivibrio stercorigallinarum TaxID=2840704 RepID=A0A9D9DB20_9GAMM|nr:flagellar protein FliT [Candidatus Avisuccinivibrio stercorigallinarum]